jgi:hypothetical protein
LEFGVAGAQESQMKRIRKVVTVYAVAASALIAGCSNDKSGSASDLDAQTDDALIVKIDKHGEEILASTAKAEAREWMKQRGHIFFKADPKQVLQFVEEFYGKGAKQVLVGDIEEHDGSQYGEALLVVLPKDAKTRAKLFEVNTRAETAFENDDVPDKGQKYLYYSLD